jgi:hypothetical protein
MPKVLPAEPPTAKNLERVEKDGYSIEVSHRSSRLTVVLNGTFDMTALPDLQKNLDEVRQEIIAMNPTQLDIDVSSVFYLGSSCIKAFIALTAAMKAHPKPPKMRIITSGQLDWQDRAFAALSRLAPEFVAVERSS